MTFGVSDPMAVVYVTAQEERERGYALSWVAKTRSGSVKQLAVGSHHPWVEERTKTAGKVVVFISF